MEHAELLETAFVDYLTAFQTGTPAALPWSSGLQILPGENNLDKTGSRIVAYVEGDLTEEPQFSSNRWATVVVELRTPFSTLTAKQIAANATEPLDVHKANAAALEAAIMDDALAAGLTGDALLVYENGVTNRDALREQADDYWMSGFRVRVYSIRITS